MADEFDMERYLNDREGCVREWEAKHGKPTRPPLSAAETQRLKDEAIKYSREAAKHHSSSYAYQQSSGLAKNAILTLGLHDPALAERVSQEATGAANRAVIEKQAKQERFDNSILGKAAGVIDKVFACHCRCHSDPEYFGCGGRCCSTE